MLWCLSRRAPSADLFLRCGQVRGLNVLAAGQDRAVAPSSPPRRRTSSRVLVATSSDGGRWVAPVLEGTLASFACRTVTVHEGGDHLIFVGRSGLEQFDRTCGEPLVFSISGRYLERVAGLTQQTPVGVEVLEARQVHVPVGPLEQASRSGGR
ncbi:flavin reductase family protein [Nonomuraea dietziae]|uniref:flavin reductase family protein n=1 Tax=Nonomuraea dietziae TaxID=65515 RepID=UPI0031E251F4